MRKFTPITFNELLNCFSSKREYKYCYIGISWNIFSSTSETKAYNALEECIKFIADKAKPKWCPRWVLNLLHLLGNDNSIVRVRNRKLHKLHQKLTGGIMVRDIKEKFNSTRIYSDFTDEIWKKVGKTCRICNEFMNKNNEN